MAQAQAQQAAWAPGGETTKKRRVQLQPWLSRPSPSDQQTQVLNSILNVSSTSEDETGGQQSSGGASQHYRQSSNSQAEMEQTMLEGRTPLAAIIMT